jgi:hypothetical protein
MRRSALFVSLFACSLAAAACGGSSSDWEAVTGDDANQTAAATVTFASGFETHLEGTPAAGKRLRVEYALDRLPQCRGNVGGGGPGWNIGGFYSENGGEAKSFEVTALSSDGRDRVSKPASILLTQGGDVAIWFEVTSAFGCHEYDSQFGQNYHFAVNGPPPSAQASIVFDEGGGVTQDGELEAGGKVRIRYEQGRLSDCRQTRNGNPVYTITGFAQIDGDDPVMFDTGRPDGYERKAVDAVVELPHEGELSLWFQTTSITGCMKYDSKNGANYRFHVGP